ncbi:MAG: VanZ family protein [Bacillus sp. (in: firmicutes)]
MKKTLFLWMPILLILAIIFAFSSQPYKDQDITPWLQALEESNFLHSFLSPVSFIYAGKEISVQALGVAHFIEFFIRKASHLTIFFILAFFTIRAVRNYINSTVKAIVISFLFVMIYAILDETHQLFTNGRTPLKSDVVVDCVGGCLGLLFYKIRKYKIFQLR